MPTFTRTVLRQTLGRDVLRDTLVSSTTGSCGALASGGYVIDSTQADLSLSGQGYYRRSWLRINGMESRVASFNVGSGAYITSQIFGTVVPSGAQYELTDLLPPIEHDRCLDWTVRRLRTNREVAIPTVDGATTYTLDNAASPNLIVDVLGCTYFAKPDGSLNRDQRGVTQYSVVTTASGTRELRISPALAGSQQIVLDAILSLSLAAADSSTVTIDDDRWLLEGAAAKAYDLLVQRGPSQEVGQYAQRRLEHARNFSDLSTKYQPIVERSIELDLPW